MEEMEELILEETPAVEEAPQPAEEPDFLGFVQQYPDLDPSEIPQSVWDAVKQGQPLLDAYRGHEVNVLRQDNLRLKQQLEDMEQQTEVRSRALGSVRSTGKLARTDSFLQGFDQA